MDTANSHQTENIELDHQPVHQVAEESKQKNVIQMNELELWNDVKQQWSLIIDKVDQEIANETNKERGEQRLYLKEILVDALQHMLNVVVQGDTNQEEQISVLEMKKYQNSLVFDSDLRPIDSLANEIQKLNANLKERSYHFQSLYRAETFLKEFEQKAQPFFKPLIDASNVEQIIKDLKMKVQAAVTNLEEFAKKERSRQESAKLISDRINRIFGLNKNHQQIRNLYYEKEYFLQTVKSTDPEVYEQRMKVGDFNYSPGNLKDLASCPFTFLPQKCQPTQKDALYFGEIKGVTKIDKESVLVQQLSDSDELLESKLFQMHGRGMYLDIYEGGSLYEGWFQDGKLIYGRCINRDTYYVGKFENFKFSGRGTMYFRDGNMYSGLWKDSQFSGEGTFTYYCGAQWTGIFKNGKGKEGIFNGNIRYPQRPGYDKEKFPGYTTDNEKFEKHFKNLYKGYNKDLKSWLKQEGREQEAKTIGNFSEMDINS